MLSKKTLFKYHSSNHKEIKESILIVQNNIRDSIRQENKVQTTLYTKMYAMMLGMYAETALLKLLYDRDIVHGYTTYFSDLAIEKILQENTQESKWNIAISFAYKKRYFGDPFSNKYLNEFTLKHSVFTSYKTICTDLINGQLTDIITIRNRLAHGQWQQIFNSTLNAIEPKYSKLIHTENIITLMAKQKIIDSLISIIADLTNNLPGFINGFDKHWHTIIQHKEKLNNPEYQSYCADLVQKYQKGQAKRQLDS